MKNLACVLLLILGCGEDRIGVDPVAVSTAFRDEACGCKDRACAEKVTRDIMKFGEAHDRETQKWSRDRELMAKIEPIWNAIRKCLDTATAGNAGLAEDPNADVPNLAEHPNADVSFVGGMDMARAEAFLTELGSTIEKAGRDCDKMATELEAFLDKSRDTLKGTKAFEKSLSPEDKTKWDERASAIFGMHGEAIGACLSNRKVRELFWTLGQP